MRDAISTYHGLLEDEQLAADSQGMLDELQSGQRLIFGGRPLGPMLAREGRPSAD